jgi:hypothetical protein
MRGIDKSEDESEMESGGGEEEKRRPRLCLFVQKIQA